MHKDLEQGTILAVDDERRILDLIGITLKFAGLNAETTQDPHEALEIYRNNAQRIPVVVTDRNYHLDIKGDEFSRRVREIADSHQPPLNVKIVMVTADYLTPEITRKIKNCGVNVIVPKPFSPTKLLDEIKKGRDQFMPS